MSTRRNIPDLAEEAGHFDGGEAGFGALVTAFKAGAIDCLLESVAGEDTEDHRDHSIDLRELYAASDLGADVVVMRGLAADDAADADDGVVLRGGGQFFRGDGDFEGAGNADDLDLTRSCSGGGERIESGSEQAIGDEAIEAADDYAKPETFGAERAAEFRWMRVSSHEQSALSAP